MNVDVFFAGTKGEDTGEVSLGIPIQRIAGLIVKDEDQSLLLLFFGKTALADSGIARVFYDEIDASEIIPDIVKQLL
jgi:hypothetical protein